MPEQPKPPQVEHVDVPSVSETFVDSTGGIEIRDGLVRLELCATRMDGQQIKKYTACRLVLPLSGFLTLAQTVNNTLNAMQMQGIIKIEKPSQPAPMPPKGKPN